MKRDLRRVAFVLLLGALPAVAETYRVTDLGTLGGDQSSASAINEQGQVVGWALTGAVDPDGGSIRHAFLWLPEPAAGLGAGIHDLGTLGGDNSWALDVNEALQVVGGAHDGTVGSLGEALSRPFLWQAGSMSDLGTANAGFSWAEARSINNSGQVVGGEFNIFFCQPFLWLPAPAYGLPAGIQTLARPAGLGEGEAFGINDSGEVASRSTGACDTTSGSATLWLPAAAHGLPAGPTVLTPDADPNRFSQAAAINALGEVVGIVEDDDAVHSFFTWSDGTLTVLPPLPTTIFAYVGDVNDHGHFVGGITMFGPPASSDDFVWRDGVATPINDLLPAGSPWVLTQVSGINNRGQIVGRGMLDGEGRAFLLTPILFEDGFESGDTSAWSAAVGES